jgi:hypothetical protein
MDALELFSAGIRILGLLSAGRGIIDLLYTAMASLDLTSRSVTAIPPYVDFVYGMFYLLMGLYLIRGAPWLIDFAFPGYVESGFEREDRQDSAENEDEAN